MKMNLQNLSRTLRERFQSRGLANHAVGIVTATRNGTLVVDPEDANVSRHLLNNGEYEWPEVTMLSRLVNKDSRLVFVGAHIGALLIPIVRASGASSVLAFEARPRNYQMLQMNLALNGITGVATENIAVGDRPGRKRYVENLFEIRPDRAVNRRNEVDVTIHTLDAALPRDWTHIDLLVMGMEGFEVAALRGISRTLSRILHLYVEVSPERASAEGSTVEELLLPVANQFHSAYFVASRPRFIARRDLAEYLLALPRRRGQILKVLFTRDTSPRPQLTQTP